MAWLGWAGLAVLTLSEVRRAGFSAIAGIAAGIAAGLAANAVLSVLAASLIL